jgi:hypothetical protein
MMRGALELENSSLVAQRILIMTYRQLVASSAYLKKLRAAMATLPKLTAHPTIVGLRFTSLLQHRNDATMVARASAGSIACWLKWKIW